MLLASAVVLGAVFVGPWPTYGPGDLDAAGHFLDAIDALTSSAADSELTSTPGSLLAGWAKQPLSLPPAVPLGGYGHRRGRPSVGVHDRLTVGALVLGDGTDDVVIVASDLLIVPEDVAARVRSAVAERLPLGAGDILFNATHTHSGPGAFAPGWLGRQFAGAYDPRVVDTIAASMTAAIADAWNDRAAARLGHGKLAVPEHVTNRARPGGTVDPDLHFLRIERNDGALLTVVSYAAHATLLGPENMELAGDYPSELVRALERQTGGDAVFLAGAVGSMAPVAPDALEGFEGARTLGATLAARVARASATLVLHERLDVASAGTAIQMPPFQVRLTRRLRLSPFLVRRLGVNNQAWIQGVRVGNTVLVGAPADFSGELSVELKAWAAAAGFDLWALSFNGDYVGYISPDRYYTAAPETDLGRYEMYLMNWCGPRQGEMVVRLLRRTAEALLADP